MLRGHHHLETVQTLLVPGESDLNYKSLAESQEEWEGRNPLNASYKNTKAE